MAPRPDVSDKRKAEIVEAAARVFSKKGFGGARMDDIVQETGLSKGLLYWYFKSKDALIVALLERLMRPELNRVRTLADAGGPARERLVAFAESMVKDIALMERLMPITFEFYSVAFRNKVMKKAFQEFFRIFIDGIQRVIEQGIAAGEFRAVDSRRIALAIMASMEGNLLLWVFDRSNGGPCPTAPVHGPDPARNRARRPQARIHPHEGGREMRKITFAFALVGLVFSESLQPAEAQALTADQVVRSAEQSVFPDAFVMHATLETLPAESPRMEMTVSYKRNVGSRIELLAPARSRGLRFLQKEDALWLFNPQAGTSQAIRLSPKAAFQGSVFSNRDIGDPQYSTEYVMRLAGTETIDHPDLGSVPTIVLEGTARNESVAYSKIKLWVRSSDDMLLKGEYYAKSGLLFKRALFTGIRELAGRERPTVIRMISLDQPDRESVMTITSLEEKPDLSDALFSLAALTR